MNRKGIFVSAIAVLCLLSIIMFYKLSMQDSAQRSGVSAEYLGNRMIAAHMAAIEESYLPAFISASGKSALVRLSYHIAAGHPVGLENAMTEVMMTGRQGGTLLLDERYVLPTLLNHSLGILADAPRVEEFDFRVTGFRQLTAWSVVMHSEARLVLARENILWNSTRSYESVFLVNGLVYPALDELIVTDFWEENDTMPCVLRSLDAGQGCTGNPGVCPWWGCY